MAFSRAIMPRPRPEPAAITGCMAGVGMNFAADPDVNANIEDTLIYASELGMCEGDLRVLAILTTWFGVHHSHVNADRLVRVVAAHQHPRVRAYWSAVATWLAKDRRFNRLARAYQGEREALLPVGTEFQIARRGEDERFAAGVLRAAAGTLRDRPEDVLDPEALCRLHPGYKNRVRMGPSWRADVWTLLERHPDLTVADVARGAYCSFATAWQVTQDFRLMRRAAQPH